ncbi:MAG TPA: DUF2238 domain-containing protein [Planctomycetota bacterium]|nr:DUF2238 domain-containing protein [Planctomycetota bacterium]
MKKLPRPTLVLAVAFWVAVIWSAIFPYRLEAYLLEIVTPVLGFFLLLGTARFLRFTDLAYGFMFLEGIILLVGAHYTHERVPLFDWLKDALGLERNHYDRFAHFCVGFFMAVPVRELLLRMSPLRGKWLFFFIVMGILGFAAFYEISEWWVAVLASPEAGAAYLGMQGDPWDAQKDMLLDGLGALVGVVAFSRLHDRALLARGIDPQASTVS